MKRGFTLVEMLAVITLLGLLALVIVPATEAVIASLKNDSYEAQIETLKTGLKNWSAEHVLKMPANNGEYIETTLGQLKKEGFIEVEFRDPRDNKCFNNNTILRVTKTSESYKYEVVGTITTTDVCEVE